MTEGEENIIIKGVLLEAISRDFSEELSNNKEVSVSPRFKRQMMAMMNNPNKWAERHKRDYRRRFVKVWQSLNDMYLGYGLVQWDDGKLFIDWAKKEGVISAATAEAVNSLAYSNPKKLMDAELDYLIVSMNTVGNWFKPDNNQSKYGTSETLTASQFKVSNKSADILARIFCGHYERPGVPKISERVANAKKWYNFL